MKKFLLGIAMALVAGSSSAQVFTLEPAEISLKPGDVQDVEMILHSAVDAYSAFQIVISMPDGIEPVCLNQEDVDDFGDDPLYYEVTLPHIGKLQQRFNAQRANSFYRIGEEVKKGDVVERIATTNELHIIFYTQQAYTFPKEVTVESALKFQLKATDKGYTGKSYVALNEVIMTTAETVNEKVDDITKAATIDYSIEYEIGESGYGTLCWPVALDFSDNSFVAGYGVTASKSSGNFMQGVAVKKVPAATPVIIMGAPGKYNLTTTKDTDLDDVSKNELEGTVDGPFKVNADNIFALSNVGKEVGFYRCKKDLEIPQYKAYYISNNSSVNAFLFEETTGINEIESAAEATDTYTLSGVKVNNASHKGIYIFNGKKVVVK